MYKTEKASNGMYNVTDDNGAIFGQVRTEDMLQEWVDNRDSAMRALKKSKE